MHGNSRIDLHRDSLLTPQESADAEGTAAADIGAERRIGASGLFERHWYLERYPEVASDDADPLTHFCETGWRQGLQPNAYFDPAWYARTYGAELAPDQNPVMHYLERGERENAWPSQHFDPEWYRDHNAIPANESPLRHYLRNRHDGALSPLPVFDAATYTAEHPDWQADGLDPYEHFLTHEDEYMDNPDRPDLTLATLLEMVGGSAEDGELPVSISGEAFAQVLRLFIPLIPFNAAWYVATNPDVAQALEIGALSSAHDHFVDNGFFEGRSPVPPR